MLYGEINYKLLNHDKLHSRTIKKVTSKNAGALVELILSNSNALADPQQAFHRLLGDPWTPGWEPLS